MGIRGLETHMFRIEGGTTKVDIRKEIENFKKQNPKVKPIIVIDYLNLHRHWQSKAEILCGLRAHVYMNKARSFFQSLKDAGAELVFFDDGPKTEPEKFETWFKRRNEKYIDYLKVFDLIDNQTPISHIEADEQRYIHTSVVIKPYHKKVAREMGKLYISHNVDCDLEMASFACKNNALAILADDSDFLIYPGSWRYWSVKFMDWDRLATVQYNKSTLRSHLNLTVEQMPLFASIAGNDIVSFDFIKDFQRRLGNLRFKFENTAKFMRSYPTKLSDEHLKKLARDVCSNKKFIESVKQSIASYDIDNKLIKFSESDPFMQDLLTSETGEFPYSVLKRFTAEVVNHYDDMRRYNSSTLKRCYSKLALELHLRQVGILLNSRRTEKLKEHVLIKLSHSTKYEEFVTDPDYPPTDLHVPPLDQLIFPTEGDLLDEHRYRLFQWIYFDTFDAEKLFKLPKAFVPILATLCFLIKKWELTEDEADIFLISCKESMENKEPKKLKCPEILDERAFRITHVILQVQYNTYQALNLVGLEDFAELLMFDGFHFQNRYKEWIHMDTVDKKSLEKSITDFNFMYRSEP